MNLSMSNKNFSQMQKIIKTIDPATDLLTTEQLANELQVSPMTIHNWKRHGKIPVIRFGTRVRYKLTEVQAAFNQSTATA